MFNNQEEDVFYLRSRTNWRGKVISLYMAYDLDFYIPFFRSIVDFVILYHFSNEYTHVEFCNWKYVLAITSILSY